MQIDFSKLQEEAGGAAEPLPAGNYEVVVRKVEQKMSANQKLMFAVTLRVEEGPHKGRRLWQNVVVSPENPQAMAMFFVNMKAFGLGKEFFAPNPSPDFVCAAMIDRRLNVDVGTRVWQGDVRNEIKKMRQSAAGVGAGPLPGVPQAPVAAPPAAPAAVPSENAAPDAAAFTPDEEPW
jgi:Protein of unknown function (DUF669)